MISPNAWRALRTLGKDLQTARRRRRLSQEDFAARMSVSVGTLKHLEAGKPGVSIGSLAMAMLCLGELEKLAHLMDMTADETGLLLNDAALPKRIRKTKHRAPYEGKGPVFDGKDGISS